MNDAEEPLDGGNSNPIDFIAEEEGFIRVGRLIDDYNRAQHGFVPSDDAIWRDEGRDPSGSTEVIAHNDLAPWSLVAGPGGWVFIDWDLAAPGRRMWDLTWALHASLALLLRVTPSHGKVEHATSRPTGPFGVLCFEIE